MATQASKGEAVGGMAARSAGSEVIYECFRDELQTFCARALPLLARTTAADLRRAAADGGFADDGTAVAP